ncbi:hypothetical protein [Micromonospora siamensis]|uniref:Uncharacterized protein n=1 Tax=Micromonospora siamensis TaxID=299152 RepID=A0A1C5HJ06_9ACTN|nr:hypothetical protein [Micromonospora siamensis]SCG45847.1 hypothetical protein GA0074704_1800 [Micromonospora siamensis]
MSSTRSRRVPGQPEADEEEVHRADAELTTCGTIGMPPSARVLFAVVDADGTLVRGLGAASSARLATGMYQVTFDQDVTRAGYLGTLGRVGNLGVSRVGDIAVAGRTGIPNGVFVETFADDGNRADRAFHLAVLA